MKTGLKILCFILLTLTCKGQKLSFKFEKIRNVNTTQINDICIDAQNNKWIATDNGLIKIDARLEIQYFNTANSRIQSNHLNCLYKDYKDNIWIGTYNVGLIKKDSNDRFSKISYIGNEKQLLIHDIGELGNKILLATPTGLYTTSKLDSSQSIIILKRYKANPEIRTEVNAILVLKDTLIIATNTGVYKMIDDFISPIGSLNQVHSICYFNDYLWAEDVNSKSTDIVYYKKKWKRKELDFLKDSLINTQLFADGINKCMWIASRKLFMFTSQKILPIEDNKTFKTKLINCIVTDKTGVVWIGTADNGLYKLTIDKLYDSIFSRDSIRLNITFEDASYKLTKSAKIELDKIAFQLLETPNIRIKINGHTDFGYHMSEKELLELSEKRAVEVKRYLIKNGHMDKNRIVDVRGYGSQFATKEGRYNMRVEIIITER